MRYATWKDIEMSIGGAKLSGMGDVEADAIVDGGLRKAGLVGPVTFEATCEVDVNGSGLEALERWFGDLSPRRPSRLIAAVDVQSDVGAQYLVMVPSCGRWSFDLDPIETGPAKGIAAIDMSGDIVAWCPTAEARDAAARLLSL